MQGDVGTIGITDYAQHELGDVVFVELPKVGAKLKAGQSFGTVESVKAVSEIYSPVSGEVTEINPLLADSPEKINQDPHNAAWLIKVKLADPKEVAGLMDAAAYQAYIAEASKGTLGLMRYLPKSPSERQEMLEAIGVRFDRRSVQVHPREIPPARAASICPGRFPKRRSSTISRRAPRKMRAATPAFWAPACTSICVRWHRRDDPARRIPHLLHAVSGRDSRRARSPRFSSFKR